MKKFGILWLIFLFFSIDISAQKTKTKKKSKPFNGCIYFGYPEPEFPGGEDSLVSFLRKNIEYPSIFLDSNIKEPVKIIYSFDINKKGKIENINYDSTIDKLYDPFIKEGLRGLYFMQKTITWKMPKNITHKTKITLPINFD